MNLLFALIAGVAAALAPVDRPLCAPRKHKASPVAGAGVARYAFDRVSYGGGGGGGGRGGPDDEPARAALSTTGGASKGGLFKVVRDVVVKVVWVLASAVSTLFGLVLSPKKLFMAAGLGGVAFGVYVALGLQSGQTEPEDLGTFDEPPRGGAVPDDAVPDDVPEDVMDAVEHVEVEETPVLYEDDVEISDEE
jgi:hypothetical protein